MVIPAVKSCMLIRGSMRTDSLLEAASRGHLKNCSFWHFVSLIFQLWKLSLKSKPVDWSSIVAVWHHMLLLASMYRVSSAATTHQLALQEVTRHKHVHWFFKLPAFPYCLNFSVQHSDLNRELVFLSAVLLCWTSLHTLQPLKNKADLSYCTIQICSQDFKFRNLPFSACRLFTLVCLLCCFLKRNRRPLPNFYFLWLFAFKLTPSSSFVSSKMNLKNQVIRITSYKMQSWNIKYQ